ncbi:hypothetical protein SAMN04489844_0241 [Nocardioides exalbidus]|uniref:Uncharacterized protein n=1 Tax=Nocardioides exalbidus TaxID=402596 RepID=A0A1H4JR88_9ACTN|nr:hypothetical protein [Nocardioides exalbidus]SEB48248.1 hypothetical protein SAMN04489844_0241 [Nocardioides exalbidus]
MKPLSAALATVLTAVLAVVVLVSPPAQAGTASTLGVGSSPSIYVDPATGTAHVVWINTADHTLTYCRVPRGATSCSVTTSLPAPAGGPIGFPARATILRTSPSSLAVVMAIPETDKTYSWVSSNGDGAWLQAGVHGSVGQQVAAGPAFYNPVGWKGFVLGAGGRVWRTMGTDDASSTTHATLTGGGVIDFQVAPLPTGNQTIAVGNDGTTATLWRTPTGSDPRNQAGWGPATALGAMSNTRLGHGPSGVYLFGSSAAGQVVRKWDQASTSFGPPTVVANEAGHVNDVTVGPSGAVAAIWRRNEAAGGNRLQLALSPDGTSYGVTTIAREDSAMADMEVALSDNGGFAVWEGATTGATSQIRIADLSTVPDPVPPPTTPTTTPITPTPTTPTAATRTVTAKVAGGTVSLTVPNLCVPPGTKLVAKVDGKKGAGRKATFKKVVRVDFFSGKLLKKDRSAPFTQTLRIPRPKAGATYTVTAKVHVSVTRGKAATKKIAATVTTCG